MGLKDIAYAVNSTVKDQLIFKPLDKLIEQFMMQYLNSTIGTGSLKTLDTLMEELKTAVASIQTNVTSGGVPIVKSVQRGTTTSTSVTISSVNPDKCIVILNNQYIDGISYLTGGDKSHTYGTNSGAIVSSLTATKLTITANSILSSARYDTFDGWIETTSKGKVSWQVIEFY